MRVVFLGTPAAAVPSLHALLDAGHDVALVVTRPDRPAGRSRRPLPPPVKLAAAERGLEVVQPRRVKGPEFAGALAARSPDVLVVVAYGRILAPAVLAVPRLAPVNVHFSLLPAYRGAAPVQWALARGETRTGVSTMLVSEGLDEGDVLLQRELVVAPGEHAPTLERRLAGDGAGLLVRTVELLAAGAIEPQPQDHAAASYAPRLSVADGRIDPALPARAIEGRVRGFDPWPGVWLGLDDRRIRLWEARATGEPAPANVEPGTLLDPTGGAVPMVCGEGTLLRIERLQVAGRRPTAARDAVNGRQIVPGERLCRIDPDA